MKNTFAPINRIPPEVFTLVPDYWEDNSDDGALIGLTHVCRGWRELFISRPSLWTRLDCTHADKTRAYIERSKTSPLDICLGESDVAFCLEEALLLAVPHFGRLGTLSVFGCEDLPVLVKHLSCSVPLLSKLEINLACDEHSVLPNTLFNGDLSSLRELRLVGVVTTLPWRGLSKLTRLNLCHVSGDNILLTQLLDFFESAPHLRHIRLHDSIPTSSNAPADRVVSLPHLKDLSIIAQSVHSILLNHLSIPAGVSLRLEFTYSGKESPIPFYLPNPLDRLHNLSYVTAVNLRLASEQRSVRLSGPSGELYMVGRWTRGGDKPYDGIGAFLRSLSRFDISRTQWLTVTLYRFQPSSLPTTGWTIYQTFLSMKDLRTLTLSRCNNLTFILALNPSKNPSKTILCPKLEEIILYIERPDQFHVDELLSMAKERASGGVKLSTITIVSTEALAPTKEVFQLRKHVSRVEYKFDDAPPEWDTLPNEVV